MKVFKNLNVLRTKLLFYQNKLKDIKFKIFTNSNVKEIPSKKENKIFLKVSKVGIYKLMEN